MKNMFYVRKALALGLCTSIIFSITACKKDVNDTSASIVTTAASASETTTATETETVAPETTEPVETLPVSADCDSTMNLFKEYAATVYEADNSALFGYIKVNGGYYDSDWCLVVNIDGVSSYYRALNSEIEECTEEEITSTSSSENTDSDATDVTGEQGTDVTAESSSESDAVSEEDAGVQTDIPFVEYSTLEKLPIMFDFSNLKSPGGMIVEYSDNLESNRYTGAVMGVTSDGTQALFACGTPISMTMDEYNNSEYKDDESYSLELNVDGTYSLMHDSKLCCENEILTVINILPEASFIDEYYYPCCENDEDYDPDNHDWYEVPYSVGDTSMANSYFMHYQYENCNIDVYQSGWTDAYTDTEYVIVEEGDLVYAVLLFDGNNG